MQERKVTAGRNGLVQKTGWDQEHNCPSIVSSSEVEREDAHKHRWVCGLSPQHVEALLMGFPSRGPEQVERSETEEGRRVNE